ncbi:POL2 [Sanghuangporus weigelae]
MSRRGGGNFGLSASRRARGSFRGYGRGAYFARGGRGRGRGGSNANAVVAIPTKDEEGTQLAERFEQTRINDEVDEKLGFARVQEGPRREGWLINMHPTLVRDPDHPSGRAAVDFYFIENDGSMFKTTFQYEPYFCISCKSGTETVVEEWLNKKYEGLICRIVRERKEDLKLPNHLMGHRRLYLQLCFRNVSDLLAVRREIVPLAMENGAKLNAVDAYAEVVNMSESSGRVEVETSWAAEADALNGLSKNAKDMDPRDAIIDAREFDVPYYLRVAIDNELRVGLWYTVSFTAGQPQFTVMDRVKRADPVVLAYDIETTKAPLKFPDSAVDQVMMISYMIDGQGFLIINREIVSEDVDDFEYTPKEGIEGPFTVFNEEDEAATIMRFFRHCQEVKPTVMATFNGDFFDFPFLCARAKAHGIDMFLEIGFAKDSEDEFKSRSCVHMDCFRWVKRDSYLPQGSQGLKAVTTVKLGYDPIELDPELMTPYALEQPQTLAQYSVSDAVATYYLYMKYVHPFIFSLCNIIPLCPDEVLRKGTGTLCETLLMVEAYRAHIIMPNRHEDPHGNMFEGHLLSSETYVGGHVEALEAGVFRSDIATHFKIVPEAAQKLIDELDAALIFCIIDESKCSMDEVVNYEQVKGQIQAALEVLRDNPLRFDKPLIYHLDVAAMYPNIMLSNRLQPDSVVDESVCAVCDFNRPGKACDRRMTWAWRGEYFPAQRDEYNMVRHALNQESFPPKRPDGPQRRFADLSPAEQAALLHKRLGDYSRKVYKKTKETRIVERETIICQRENPFYVDTVRRFRDRRYEYKGLHKTWKKSLDGLLGSGGSIAEVDEAKKMIVIYDSLQLAHKCILNSFYGYVMRKGARWHSMEMAGITCLTGATIIQMARQLVEQIGRPLELDTDGIWCMLPGVFPENFKFKLTNGKSVGFSYPCTMLNHLVHAKFTNHQYHDLDHETGQYKVHSENSIFFELDGPYKAMILPSSKEEDKLLKKRYAVFNDDGSLAELKGFEVKRRGELQLIKIFQSQIFEKFLLGATLQECYAAVSEIADRWLDVLFSKAESLSDEELVDLIAENRSMSRTLAEYAGQKSTSISTARRLAEFLGDQMVKDKGLACKFIISAKPIGAPVTDRAVPVAIFSTEESVKRTYLRKWLKDNSLVNFDLRAILDWDYYIERLGSVIQKLITIPAAMQKVPNPVPRIRHPDWLYRRVAALGDKFKQHKMTDFFKKPAVSDDSALQTQTLPDLEDLGIEDSERQGHSRIIVTKRAPRKTVEKDVAVEEDVKPPNPHESYPKWLKVMKKRWRHHLQTRENEDASGLAVPAMFRGVKNPTSRHWDIVQILPIGRGRFNMWLCVNSELVSVTLRIPREFYLNFKTPPKEDEFEEHYSREQVIRTLPRNRPCSFLYKYSMSEETFLQGESYFTNEINNTNVDGAYELQVPLVVRALMKLGTSCTTDVKGLTLNRARDDGVDLWQLDMSSPSPMRKPYLDNGKPLKCLFLYHAFIPSTPVNVFALFLPNGTVKMHVVDPATRRQPIPRFDTVYEDMLAKKRADLEKFSTYTYPDELRSTTDYHSNEATALKAISRELGLLEKKSFTVILSSARDFSYFSKIPKLSKFPVLRMSSTRASHALDVFPWQSAIAKKMFVRYFSLAPWLRRTIIQAAYYNVPIGHIGDDQPLFFCDIELARRLSAQDLVIWWSAGEKPDLGGFENDMPPAEELVNPEFLVSGLYSNVCLSVQVGNLAIDAVLQSALVNELEGSGGTTAFDSTSHTLDDYSSGEAQPNVTIGDSNLSPQIFSTVKQMVRSWLLDKAKDPSGPASITLDHFWRWVSSSSAMMYEPSIQRFVHGLMRKTFIQMLAEFKRLGSNVVYADFSRIILVTSKPPGTAHAYATYINTAVTSNELFKHIYLRTDRFYDFLLYMNPANLGAVVCEDPLAIEPPKQITISSHWNINKFLPPAVQTHFRNVVRYFITHMAQIRRDVEQNTRTPLRMVQNLGPDTTQRDGGKLKEIDESKAFITQKLTRRMLHVVSTIQEEHKRSIIEEGESSDFTFPVLPGSYLHMTDPILEFIKFAGAVFGLAQDYQIELGLLKRNLLELVGVREFSDEAIFRNPCDPLKLSMVTCRYCDHIRDFDFCRDDELLSSSSSLEQVHWYCLECDGEYDKTAIEFSLIQMLHRIERNFTQQDLCCSRCKQIQSDNVSRHCECSGSYALTTSKADVRRKLRTIINVAITHNLARLRECAQLMYANW